MKDSSAKSRNEYGLNNRGNKACTRTFADDYNGVENLDGGKSKNVVSFDVAVNSKNSEMLNVSDSKNSIKSKDDNLKNDFTMYSKIRIKAVFKWTFAGIAFLFIFAVLLLNLMFPFKYSDIVSRQAAAFGVDKSLVYAVIWTESKFDSNAVSSAGAVGLMQLMPKTAEWCAAKTGEQYTYSRLSDPEVNIKLGTYYLSYLIKKYGEKDALAAYNAGEGNLSEWDGEIKFKETRDFVKRVNLASKVYGFKMG